MSAETTQDLDHAQPSASPASPTQRSLLFRLLGLKRRSGRFVRIGLTRWGWLLAVLIVGGVGRALPTDVAQARQRRALRHDP